MFWRQGAAAAAAARSQVLHTGNKLISTSKHMCSLTFPGMCQYTSFQPLIFLSSLLSVVIYSSTLLSPQLLLEYRNAASPSDWKCKGGVQNEVNTWLGGWGEGIKNGAAEYFIKHFWGTPQIWILMASASEPASVSVIVHQPSEGEPFHQQALWDSEYLKLHLAQTELHLCSDLL